MDLRPSAEVDLYLESYSVSSLELFPSGLSRLAVCKNSKDANDKQANSDGAVSRKLRSVDIGRGLCNRWWIVRSLDRS